MSLKGYNRQVCDVCESEHFGDQVTCYLCEATIKHLPVFVSSRKGREKLLQALESRWLDRPVTRPKP